MGSGKTTISRELSKELPQYTLIDIDSEIEKSTQKKISEIFLKHGEPFFRMLESDKIKKFCTGNKKIISAGGGAFENENNRKIMLENGVVIYLKATAEEIFNRIKNETHRPLLKRNFSLEKIQTIMEKRAKNYSKANYTIDTTDKTPYNIVKEILGAIND